MEMGLYLGVDAGGSKTECAIADDQDILGRYTAGSCKIQQVGAKEAAKNLRATVHGALSAAKAEGGAIEHACVGISGISEPGVANFVKDVLRSVVSGEITVVGDHIIAHEAAFRGGAGVLVIAGTGSIAYGRNEHGITARAGGRGAAISDEGSGFWIGREAVAATMRVSDAEDSSELLKRIMQKWKIKNNEALARVFDCGVHPGDPALNFAELFPEVLAASKSGDQVARQVLWRAGEELAKIALLVIGRLWSEEKSKVTVAGAGGVLVNSAEVRGALQCAFRGKRSTTVYDDRVVDPVEGALYLARSGAVAAKSGPA